MKSTFRVSRFFEFRIRIVMCVSFLPQLSLNVYRNTLKTIGCLLFPPNISGGKSEQLIVEVCFDKYLMIVQ